MNNLFAHGVVEFGKSYRFCQPWVELVFKDPYRTREKVIGTLILPSKTMVEMLCGVDSGVVGP